MRSLRKLLRSWEMGRFPWCEDREMPQNLLEGCICGYVQRVWGGLWRGQAGLGKVDTMNLLALVSCPLAGTILCP